ncbi:hypothetical protein [Aquimarina aggregata]|uniref:hypothetical protein n=1 Tax=Aquimarina aggregata TaxID=1642818 RepID=UPI002492DAA1|nr:hypothetical protein [Aquimarina aggregata]
MFQVQSVLQLIIFSRLNALLTPVRNMKAILFVSLFLALEAATVGAMTPKPKDPNIECLTEDEILVELENFMLLVPRKMAAIRPKGNIPPVQNGYYCRYKWQKALPVREITFNNLNEYTDERKELLPYKYILGKNGERQKLIEAGEPLMQRMKFRVKWLDKPYEAKTLEEMVSYDLRNMIANHYRQKKYSEPATGKSKEFLLGQVNNPRRLKLLEEWEEGKVTLKSLPQKEGFYEFEKVQPISSKHYYGYLPNLKIPVRLSCGKDRICGCRVVLDKHILMIGNMMYPRKSDLRYMQGLNIYAEECEVAVKELLMMKEGAQKLINKQQNKENE